jgi:hypothetical protein
MFKTLLLTVTCIPFLFFPLAQYIPAHITINSCLVFLASAHVPTTTYFYINSDFRNNIIIKNPIKYITTPVALFVGSGLIYLLSPEAIKPYWLLMYWSWQSYHYGRQNIGVYAIASGGISKIERQCIELAAIAGGLSGMKINGSAIAPQFLDNVIDGLFYGGMFLQVAVILITLYILSTKAYTVVNALFLLLCNLFFLPAFLSNDNSVNFFTYATAHGLQYILFMSAIALPDIKKSIIPAILFIGCLLCGGWLFTNQWGESAISVFVSGGFLGLTIAHFVVDAHAWKLSQPEQREFIKKRLNLITIANN